MPKVELHEVKDQAYPCIVFPTTTHHQSIYAERQLTEFEMLELIHSGWYVTRSDTMPVGPITRDNINSKIDSILEDAETE